MHVPVIDAQSRCRGRRQQVHTVGAPLEVRRVLGAELRDTSSTRYIPHLNVARQIAETRQTQK